jgi:hypothetical protein
LTDQEFREIQRFKATIDMHKSKLSLCKNKVDKMIHKNAILKYETLLLELENKIKEG